MWVRASDGNLVNLDLMRLVLAVAAAGDSPAEVRAYPAAPMTFDGRLDYEVLLRGADHDCMKLLDAITHQLAGDALETVLDVADVLAPPEPRLSEDDDDPGPF